MSTAALLTRRSVISRLHWRVSPTAAAWSPLPAPASPPTIHPGATASRGVCCSHSMIKLIQRFAGLFQELSACVRHSHLCTMPLAKRHTEFVLELSHAAPHAQRSRRALEAQVLSDKERLGHRRQPKSRGS